MTNATVHTPGEIEKLLMLGLAPITDNADALGELGFSRSYPQCRTGFESTVWERSIDQGYRETAAGLRRVMMCQRAYLVTKAAA